MHNEIVVFITKLHNEIVVFYALSMQDRPTFGVQDRPTFGVLSKQGLCDLCSLYQFLRNQMSQLIRSKQLDHSKNCFSLLSTIQQKRKYINQVRGTFSGNNRITVLRNSFSERITQDKKNCQSFKLYFFKLRRIFLR